MENIVAQDHTDAVAADEGLTDDEGLRKTVGRRLLGIGKIDPVVGTVTQKAPRPALSFSNPSPSVKVGETAEVLVTQNLDREIIVHYNLPDDACVSCEWGEFIDTFSCPLYSTGVSKGRSWVQIVLYDENEKMLTTKNIYVTVE